jgi:3-oxoacid CoA-transferase B subunit
MDLAAGARRLWVVMTLTDKAGRPKLLPRCTFPLTGAGVVDRLYTDLGVFEFDAGRLLLRETADGATAGDVASATPVDFEVAPW